MTDIALGRALLEALDIKPYRSRRMAVRKLANQVLARTFAKSDIARLIDKSPIVGTEDHQVFLRPTVSALRDQMGLDTMVNLIAIHALDGGSGASERRTAIMDAIIDPAEHAMRADTRTGYHFGHPHDWDAESMELNLNALRSAIPVGTPRFAPTSMTTPKETDEAAEIAGIVESVIAHKEKETMTEAAHVLPLPGESEAALINMTMERASLPPIAELLTKYNTMASKIESMSSELAAAMAKAEAAAAVPVEVESSGEIPAGKVDWVPAHEAFQLEKGKDSFAFNVPVWTWEGQHPHVPAADPDYVFRPFELLSVLMALATNKPAWLHGHSGTGKTTLIEQVAAKLGYPFMRLNFDSEITRMDLIGRDTLVREEGESGAVTVSRFVDGILPQMMQQPCIACLDEMDFVRPDVSYVMQRMLENDSLVLTEDGGRVVRPHPLFRIFATGNTVGQGDEHGMYQGARVQSAALLDRFKVWVHVDYLKSRDRKRLIKARVAGLTDDRVRQIDQYVGEHLEAFTQSKVLQPLSPRGFIGLAEAVAFYQSLLDPKDAMARALDDVILARASQQDRAVLRGIADRVFK